MVTKAYIKNKLECGIFGILSVGYVILYILITFGMKSGDSIVTMIIKMVVSICVVSVSLFFFSRYIDNFGNAGVKSIAYFMFGLCMVYCIVIFIDKQSNLVSILKGENIQIWKICIHKSVVFNIEILITPLLMIVIRSCLKTDELIKSKMLVMCIVILHSIMSLSLFIEQWNNNTYAFQLVYLLWVSVCWLILVLAKSKTSDEKKSKYKHAAASVILYTIFMFILIIAGIMIFKREFMPDCSSKSCMYSGYFEEICRRLDNRGSRVRAANIADFIFINASRGLLIGYILSMVAFIKIAWDFLGLKYGEYKVLQPVYNCAFYLLFIKIFAGICYGLGLSTWKMGLPFSGTVSDVVCDVVIVILLLISNRQNQMAEKMLL